MPLNLKNLPHEGYSNRDNSDTINQIIQFASGGDGVTKGSFISAVCSIHIKKDVMIGPYCFIGDYDHSYKDVTKPISKQPLININPVVIEEKSNRGFFTNTKPGDSTLRANSLLDPTTLAVIGIMITMLATMVQLFRGQ